MSTLQFCQKFKPCNDLVHSWFFYVRKKVDLTVDAQNFSMHRKNELALNERDYPLSGLVFTILITSL